MTPLEVVGLFGAGLVAGAINAVAGGGSLLTIPLLAALGMPATEANATNRVGVWMQAAVSTTSFARRGALQVGDARLLPAGLAGAAVGALAATRIPERAFELVVATVFVVVGLLLTRDVVRDIRGTAPAREPRVTAPGGPLAHALMFGAGLYGGFLQAGVGVLILLVFHVAGGLDLVRSNALKVAFVGVWTTLALAIFAHGGLVHWAAGAVVGVGGMVGAALGVSWAVRVKPRALKIALIAATLVAAWKMAT
ncbi:MAG: sulfite exporter TauE/SafE family protein [Myxococcales bacterium]|nr:sulfite exporter TauE/SafE family protein [Myxococcales bacterium]